MKTKFGRPPIRITIEEFRNAFRPFLEKELSRPMPATDKPVGVIPNVSMSIDMLLAMNPSQFESDGAKKILLCLEDLVPIELTESQKDRVKNLLAGTHKQRKFALKIITNTAHISLLPLVLAATADEPADTVEAIQSIAVANKLHPSLRDAVPILIDLLKSTNSYVLRSAIYGLEYSGDARAVEPLQNLRKRLDKPTFSISGDELLFIPGEKIIGELKQDVETALAAVNRS